MKNFADNHVAISGIGLTTALGQGKESILPRLYNGEHNFSIMTREGRQLPPGIQHQSIPPFLGAEIKSLVLPPSISTHLVRNLSLSARTALCTLHEAWQEANLNEVDPRRIGLIVGGNNVQQREIMLLHQRYLGKESFIRPVHAMSFMDTDIAGLCSEAFGIKGFSNTVGGASASGQLAVIQAAKSVLSGDVDVCIALGALMDISYWECQSLRSLGAMGSDRYAQSPGEASRPFDALRDGFIFGESCAALVIERSDSPSRNLHNAKIAISGVGITSDANRNPNPSIVGEANAIKLALHSAGLNSRDIDYVNPHGTGSPLGDETELAALTECGLEGVSINTAKSLLGHGLTSAGAVEIALTALQMVEGKLHPSRNLSEPINQNFQWVQDTSKTKTIKHSVSMSMGFGGINSAVCLSMQ
ncbi:beta-ketoacyl synthase N-terminal-like domain-containing protein [Teredinibacter turnerae]|uniref:beta-ketoacyl synthase N-terminal-like domain-containing protein n=1 Tax=Teredinibacter turnerae TaxID=2426 RepID=UPI0005F857A0|nr:beta-ketoacyl synthase N-terminal-like domain-containing protein [Teredinibacter turnerae]